MSESTDNISANNKRIAKNTLLLYGRMFLMMAVTLYTSRVVLSALGVEDYGTFNVVGGVVGMFAALTGSLSAAIGRFITFELGRGDTQKLHRVFCTSVNVQVALIAIVVVLMETVGLWFLNNKLVIPESRNIAANWVFQFSIATFAIGLWSVPYNAAIIAHERMSVFAYISIFDAVAKLSVAFVISRSSEDRLILYGALLLLVSIVQRIIYTWYCKKYFDECRYRLFYDRSITKEIFGFAGWNFIGASSAIIRDQGGNILINVFFGPAVNAARGIAMQVSHAVDSFVSNFMTALNPQITKNYALGNQDYTFSLVFQGARLSYYILLILSLPIIVTAPYLLSLWLGSVPEHTANFAVLVLLFIMSESLARPLVTLMLATGKIRNYQIVVGGCQLLNLPVSWLLLRNGFPAESIFVVAIAVSVLCEAVRLLMLRKLVKLPVRKFLVKVYLNVVCVTVVAAVVPFVMRYFIGLEEIMSFLILVSVSVVSAAVVIFCLGCDRHDRTLVRSFVSKIVHRAI